MPDHYGTGWWSWDSEPITRSAVWSVRPGVVICGAFRTDHHRKGGASGRALENARLIIPALQRSNYHRAEKLYALAANTDEARSSKA